jgi:hypothetical protein
MFQIDSVRNDFGCTTDQANQCRKVNTTSCIDIYVEIFNFFLFSVWDPTQPILKSTNARSNV